MRMEFAGEARALYRAAGGAPSSAPQRALRQPSGSAVSPKRARTMAGVWCSPSISSASIRSVPPPPQIATSDSPVVPARVRAKGEHGCAGGRRGVEHARAQDARRPAADGRERAGVGWRHRAHEIVHDRR